MDTLVSLAKVLRSKNSGPFEITLDVLFDNPESFRRVRDSGVLTRESLAAMYRIQPDCIEEFVWFEKALGLKVTYLRDITSGTVGDRDVYGAQQHAPLLNIRIP